MLHSRFARFNSPYIRHAGPAIEQAGELIKLLGIADGVDLHPAVILVPYPTAETDPARVLLDKPTESHTLNPAGNKPGSRLNGQVTQLFRSTGGSAAAMASISASTADRNALSEKGFVRSRKPFSTT